MEENPNPHFVIYDTTPGGQKNIIQDLETGIQEYPHIYSEALELYKTATSKQENSGIEALLRGVSYSKSNPIEAPILSKALDDWVTYMHDQIDRGFEFDESTEDALKIDPAIDEINEKAQKLKWDPERRRDNIRMERISFFIGRVIGAKQLQIEELHKEQKIA